MNTAVPLQWRDRDHGGSYSQPAAVDSNNSNAKQLQTGITGAAVSRHRRREKASRTVAKPPAGREASSPKTGLRARVTFIRALYGWKWRVTRPKLPRTALGEHRIGVHRLAYAVKM
jgi:hypothetical protein